ncbi:hypothetical protein [Amycolatopsis cihanbeyliensis]|uniref:LPXTG-motif cell wall-anchored protein n=1 Tax=Amycolatopsis cihanbeyliensis TaxID=1128664 RepID=A0A542CTG3_AMYCI|nr:hypothetical protein [Amycolatopsis cihanbeyliensis]TQI94118.1 hypothetical protein FB471_6274 [Amycolatopsis cihanbeyliensis]
MTRFGTKLAAGTAALALTAGSGTAAAQGSSGVNEDTGPVSFANAASMQVHDQIGGKLFTLVTETQRSPLRTGVSALAQDNSTVPRSPKDRETAGRHYRLSFGTFEPEGDLFPEGVPSREHKVTAALKDTTVPVAAAEANYALQDLEQPGSGQDKTVLAFQGVRNALECASPEDITSETTAEKLWVLDKDGGLVERDLPDGDQPLEVRGLAFGPSKDPSEVEDGDRTTTVPVRYDRALTTSDVSVSRLTAFDQLLRQDEWRDSEITGVAGWRVTITSHLRKEKEAGQPDQSEEAGDQNRQAQATGKATQEATGETAGDAADGEQRADRGSSREQRDTEPGGPEIEPVGTVVTTLVLGGLSCSLPRGFTPAEPGGGGQNPQPSVPVKIPAGVSSSSYPVDVPADPGGFPAGFVLIGGGLVLGAGALFTLRRGRRRNLAAPERTE